MTHKDILVRLIKRGHISIHKEGNSYFIGINISEYSQNFYEITKELYEDLYKEK